MDIDSIFRYPESWELLKKSGQPVCIYGTGDACERILDQFELRGIDCAGIFASDNFVRDREFRGFRVMSLAALEQRLGDFTVCCAFGTQLPDVMRQIEQISYRRDLIIPDLPVAGEEFFSREGLLKRRELLREVYEMLADDFSRKIFLCIIKARLTGDPYLLRGAVTGATSSDFVKLIKPRAGDIYADLGAYTGDTAETFIEMCPGHGHIYAFEPDKRSFRKCVKRLMKYDDLTLVNACAWSRDCTLSFSQSAGRQSKISAGQGSPTAARSLDSVLGGGRCDIIKYDVEGAESEALKGSAETIRRYSPRLAVSAYHRAYDLLDLPPLIKSLNGSYELHLRQPPYYPLWDTCYYALPVS